MVLRTDADAADGAVDSWLERLDVASSGGAPVSRTHVRYVLARREVYYVPRLEFEAYAATVLRDGTIANLRRVDILNVGKLGGSYVTAADRTIARVAGVSGVMRPALSASSPPILGTLLELAIETGRLYWKSPSNPPLRRRDIQTAQLVWRIDSDDRRRPGLEGRTRAVLLAARPVWYVDPATIKAGAVDLGIGADLAAIAVSSPALTARQADRSQIAWRRAIPPVANAPVGRSTSDQVRTTPSPYRPSPADRHRQRYAESALATGTAPWAATIRKMPLKSAPPVRKRFGRAGVTPRRARESDCSTLVSSRRMRASWSWTGKPGMTSVFLHASSASGFVKRVGASKPHRIFG